MLTLMGHAAIYVWILCSTYLVWFVSPTGDMTGVVLSLGLQSLFGGGAALCWELLKPPTMTHTRSGRRTTLPGRYDVDGTLVVVGLGLLGATMATPIVLILMLLRG